MKAHLKRHRDPLAKEPVRRAWGSGGLTLPCCCNPVVLVVKSRDSHKSVTASCQPRCTQLSGIALTAMVIEYVPLPPLQADPFLAIHDALASITPEKCDRFFEKCGSYYTDVNFYVKESV